MPGIVLGMQCRAESWWVSSTVEGLLAPDITSTSTLVLVAAVWCADVLCWLRQSHPNRPINRVSAYYTDLLQSCALCDVLQETGMNISQHSALHPSA